jgi:WD40 repeat protein
MPPEGAGTPQADLYSLGKVLYEINTGKDRKDFPEPPTTLGAAEEETGRRELNEITLRACQPDPHKRYLSAGQMHDELLLVKSGKSVRHLRKVERRLAVATRIGLAGAVLLLLALGGYLFQQGQTRQARQNAEQRRQLLVRSYVANGLKLQEQGEAGSALLWFVEALNLDRGEGGREQDHRARIASLLQGAPKLAYCWSGNLPYSFGVFSPEGRRLLTTCADGKARIWDVETGRQLLALEDKGKIVVAAFDPAGHRVVTGDDNGLAQTRDAETGKPLTPPLQHKTGIWRAVFCPSGRRILTLAQDRTAHVWDAGSGSAVAPFLSPGEQAEEGVFSPDSRLVALLCLDNKIRVREAESGRLVNTITGVGGPIIGRPVFGVRFSRDGRRLLWCAGKAAGLCDALTGQQLVPLMRHASDVLMASFNPDERGVLTASDDQTARVWDAATGQPLTPPMKHSHMVFGAEVSPNGKSIVTACMDGTARFWDAFTGEPGGAILKHPARLYQATFSPDGAYLATFSVDGMVRLWNLAASGLGTRGLGRGDLVMGLSVSPDSQRVATAGSDGTARLWETATGQPSALPLRHMAGVLDARFSPDGRQLATASLDGQARLWNANTGEMTTRPMPHTMPVARVAFSPDGARLLTASGWATNSSQGRKMARIAPGPIVLRTWRVSDGTPLSAPITLEDALVFAEFSPDTRRVITGCKQGAPPLSKDDAIPGEPWPTDAGAVRIWATDSGLPCGAPLASKSGVPIYFAHFSPKGRYVVTANGDQHLGREFAPEARVWDAATGQPIGSPLTHRELVVGADFSPDEQYVVTASLNFSARVWKTTNGQPVTPPLAHYSYVFDAAFSPNGRRVVTGGLDQTLCLWDAFTGEMLGLPLKHEAGLRQVLFTPDGRHVLALLGDESGPRRDSPAAQVWDLPQDSSSIESLRGLAQLLACQALDPASGLTPLSSQALQQLWQSARTDSAGYFAARPERMAAWHENQARTCEENQSWPLAVRHWDKLVAAQPANTNYRDRLASAQARLAEIGKTSAHRDFPPRASQAKRQMIDLTEHYNLPLVRPALPTRPTNDLAGLPQGVQTLGGVEFDVRGVVQLRGRDASSLPGPLPERVTGMTVHQKCQRLHFLHGADSGVVSDGTEIGAYVLWFTNGLRWEIPIVYGQDVRDWWGPPSNPPQTKDAVVAWTGSNPAARRYGRLLRLYRRTWINPLPEVEIESIDFVSRVTDCNPFLIAISLE